MHGSSWRGDSEDLIQEGIGIGVFRPAHPRLQASAILGMCNWVCTWYRPNSAPYSPDQVADHFISLLESGYLAGKPREDPVALVLKATAEAELLPPPPEDKRQVYRRIKDLCSELSKLVEQIE
jgi:hypothetical protein